MAFTHKEIKLIAQITTDAWQTHDMEFPVTLHQLIDRQIEDKNEEIAGWIKCPECGDPRAAIEQLSKENVELIALKVALEREGLNEQ